MVGVGKMNAASPLVEFGVGRTGGVGLPLEDEVAAELVVVEEARGSDLAAGKTSQADLGRNAVAVDRVVAVRAFVAVVVSKRDVALAGRGGIRFDGLDPFGFGTGIA